MHWGPPPLSLLNENRLLISACMHSACIKVSSHECVMVSHITTNSTVCSIARCSPYQRTYQSSTLVALCKGNPPMPSQSAMKGESVPTSWFHYVSSLLFHTWNMIATSENLPRRTQPMVMNAAAFGNRGKVRYHSMLLPATNSRLIKGTWLILGLRPANERRRYKVTPSLIGWAQA